MWMEHLCNPLQVQNWAYKIDWLVLLFDCLIQYFIESFYYMKHE